MNALALAVLLAASPSVTVNFQGPLAEGLSKIAQDGDLSIVILGEFKEPAAIHVERVPAETALRSVADAYGLTLTQDGTVWTVKRAGAAKPAADDTSVKTKLDPWVRKASGGAEIVKSGDVIISADVPPKGVVAYGGSVTLESSAQVEGDVIALGGDIILGDNAIIRGQAVAIGGEVKRGVGARVEGEEVSLSPGSLGRMLNKDAAKPVADVEVPDVPLSPARRAAHALLNFALLFGLGFIALALAPVRIGRIQAEVGRSPLRSFGLGLVGSVALFVLVVMLCITIVGIPLALGLVFALVMAWLLGITAAVMWAGGTLPFARAKPTLALGLGVLLYVGMGLVPWAGAILQFVLGCIGLGALLATRLGRHGPSTPVTDH